MFSSGYETFYRTDHKTGHKNHFLKTEMISSTFSEHSKIKLEIDLQKISENYK